MLNAPSVSFKSLFILGIKRLPYVGTIWDQKVPSIPEFDARVSCFGLGYSL
jgi:hypothetical protein